MDNKSFDALLTSAKEAKEILAKKRSPSRTFYIEEPNAKEIRAKFHLTQMEFANMLNISVATLRNWEQGRRRPEGPARVLLNVANSNPEVLMDLWADSNEDSISIWPIYFYTLFNFVDPCVLMGIPRINIYVIRVYYNYSLLGGSLVCLIK